MTFAIAKTTLGAHLDYTRWATGKVLEACGDLPKEDLERDLKASHGGVLGTLQHLYYADRIWLSRLEGQPRAFQEPGESPSVAELRRDWPAMFDRYRAWLDAMNEELLQEPFTYRNLSGVSCTLTRWQALLHIVNHGSIHRGQIVAMFRQLGHTPPRTDLLYYYLG